MLDLPSATNSAERYSREKVLTYDTVAEVGLAVNSILLVDIEVPLIVVLCKVLLDIDPIANRPSNV
jgi:hypothetical protein